MMGRSPTCDEKRWMSQICEVGCIVCINDHYISPWDCSPGYCLPHHIDGKTKAYAHYQTIPLCDRHHSRYHRTGLHYNLSEWEKRNGSQMDLLRQVKAIVEKGNSWNL